MHDVRKSSEAVRWQLRWQQGVTLLELMVALAIVAAALVFAVPSFQDFVVNYRTSTQTNELLADLAVARGEAVKFGRPTQLQAVGGDWSDGWIVGTDLDADGTIAGEEVIRRHGPAEEGFTIAAGLAGGGGAVAVAFGPAGTVVLPVGNGAVEFAVCRPDADAARSRGIALARSGRAEARRSSANTTVTC